jgi:hypothetical protein
MKIIEKSSQFLAAAALIGAVSIAQLSPAVAGDRTPLRHVTSVSASVDREVSDRVESRIKELHAKLHITVDQGPQWEAFATVMRQNAESIHALMVEKHANTGAMNAVDDLTSYQAVAQAHVDGLAKLIPSFEALYATMSDRQKKTADALFGQHGNHAQRSSSN